MTELERTLHEINEQYDGLFDFELRVSGDTYTIIDGCEEFYYDGYAFEAVHDRLEEAAQEDFGGNVYLECECPGRWVVVR